MPRYFVNQDAFSELKSKTVVLTGGANGIGAACVKLFLEQGANVVFGDIIDGQPLIDTLVQSDSDFKDRVFFVKIDISVYKDILNLFQTAFKNFGAVDIAINIAALTEIGNWFDPSLTLESVEKPATTKLVDVNVLGSLYFARVAVVYLRQNQKPSADKSLILFSSVAGFKESPGLFVYQATKHAVIGLMRSLRKYPPVADNIRVNTVCPWMTLTGMVAGIKDAWEVSGLPSNKPEDIAYNVLGLATDTNIAGESLYIEGGRGWAIEEGIDQTESVWLGEEPSLSLNKGQEVLGNGMDWTNREGGKE